MKKTISVLFLVMSSLLFACNGNKSYKSSDTTKMMSPDTTTMHRTMPDTGMNKMSTDTAMKK